ncbi:DUF59 domain-containing protein [Planctomycetales bacterium ZRK34]|nr:DUF59 domain-containing protein [Planctomycetales bacterium ZRK34]
MRIYDSNQNSNPQNNAGEEPDNQHDKIIWALKQVYDPEIPISIYELGLIYKVDLNEETGVVNIDMTLTTPNCPEAQYLPGQVEASVKALEGVTDCVVNIVWEPAWSKDMMSDEAKLHLGLI